jgi:hypothetical protein
VNDLSFFSPPLRGLFTAPGESRVWGTLHAGSRATLPWQAEMTLLPGFILYGLAIAGLFFSIWRLRHRLLLLAGVLAAGILSMGTRFFDGKYTYLPLFETLPGWEGLRTPSRLMIWTTLLLGILAAGTVSAFVLRIEKIARNWVPARIPIWLRLATLVPLLLVLGEGINTTPHPIVPIQPVALRSVDGPMLVLPTNQALDQNIMLWSTNRFQPMVNGGSGFTPTKQDEIRKTSETFPDQPSIDLLRQIGVKTVVLLRDRVNGTPWQNAPNIAVDSFGVQREEIGEAIVFRL